MWRGSKRDREEGPRPYDRPEVVQSIRDMQTVYGSWKVPHTLQPSFGTGVPTSGFRQNRFLGPIWGDDGNSALRHDWYKSTEWEYWIPGCLTEYCLRFHKYFRILSQRFDMIYEAAALSGLFGVHPDEAMYSEVHAEGPGRPGKHQDHKRIPLCLMIGASMRCVASGNTFICLGEELHIGGSTLLAFDKKFWKWFRKEYWTTWVVGVSDVGFDDIASIEKEEKLFRQMGLPGFITCMDVVHFVWEHTPYQVR
jgi:hypothetical protein